MSLFCFFGIHRWKYFWDRGHRRQCIRCGKKQSAYRTGQPDRDYLRWMND